MLPSLLPLPQKFNRFQLPLPHPWFFFKKRPSISDVTLTRAVMGFTQQCASLLAYVDMKYYF